MIKFKRLTIALAALFITSATAWAQTPGVAQLTVPDSWSNDYATLIPGNLPDDFVTTTADVAKAMDSPDATAQTVILIYSLDSYITFTNSGKEVSNLPATRGFLYNQQSQGTRIYYTTASNEVDLTEVTAGKQWKIESMPAANVTLNVEYEPELTATFKAANALTIEAGKATVSVTENGQPVTTATLADGKLSPLYQGQTITLTASEGYKFRSVTAKKGGAGRPAAEATADDKGKLIGADGNIYDDADAATAAGTTAVAKIIYVGSETGDATYTHGLALALADEGEMTWATAVGTCSGKNTSAAVPGASWMLPSQVQWNKMISAAGSYTALRDGFSSVGGTNMSSYYYWSSTENVSDSVYYIYFGNGNWGGGNKGYSDVRTRACLAF